MHCNTILILMHSRCLFWHWVNANSFRWVRFSIFLLISIYILCYAIEYNVQILRGLTWMYSLKIYAVFIYFCIRDLIVIIQNKSNTKFSNKEEKSIFLFDVFPWNWHWMYMRCTFCSRFEDSFIIAFYLRFTAKRKIWFH